MRLGNVLRSPKRCVPAKFDEWRAWRAIDLDQELTLRPISGRPAQLLCVSARVRLSRIRHIAVGLCSTGIYRRRQATLYTPLQGRQTITGGQFSGVQACAHDCGVIIFANANSGHFPAPGLITGPKARSGDEARPPVMSRYTGYGRRAHEV